MNVTISERAKALRQRLTVLDETGSNAAEADQLEELRRELHKSAAVLHMHLGKEALLHEADIAVSSPPALASVRKKAAGILDKFLANSKAATLKKGQGGWKAMLDDTDSASRELERSVQSAWRAHRQAIFAGDPPALIRSRLAPTSKNTDTLQRYSVLFDRLTTAFDALPQDRPSIDRVAALAERLEETAKDFDFSVPGEVKSFLEAVLSVSGAPISLLTPGVLKWLQERNGLEDYKISSVVRR